MKSSLRLLPSLKRRSILTKIGNQISKKLKRLEKLFSKQEKSLLKKMKKHGLAFKDMLSRTFNKNKNNYYKTLKERPVRKLSKKTRISRNC